MITDKILIFFPDEININKGGPSGFLAHNLLDKPREIFVFVRDLELKKKNRFHWILEKIGLIKRKNKIVQLYLNIRANEYKFIYFHECSNFELCRNYIPQSQHVILQSHAPELPSIEAKGWNLGDEICKQYEKAQANAFKRANTIIFPNLDSVPLYDEIDYDKSKIKYILSGARLPDIVRKVPLNNDKINLLYIGRRNRIKGFDIVLDSFVRACTIRDDIRLIVLGNGSDIGLENVYELGNTNNPIMWMNSVDYIINANRQSYFDLSVIEALSIGCPLLIAINYGHNYYLSKSDGIVGFNSKDEDGLFNLLVSEELKKRDSVNIANIELYNKELSDLKYYERFKRFFEQLCLENI
jgi:glycosyltransferase involved in cell wall biosynthesis